MKSVNRICLMMILCCVCCINIAQAAVNPKPFVIPELKEWKGNEGKFIPTEQTRIVYPKGNSELQRIARMLADDCNTLFNHTPQIVEGKGKKGDLILSLKKDKSLGQEGYAIRVTDRIELTAPKAIGVYWGTRTLLQIAEQNKEDLALPKGEIRDYPDYAMNRTGTRLMQLSAWNRILIPDSRHVTDSIQKKNLSICRSWQKNVSSKSSRK